MEMFSPSMVMCKFCVLLVLLSIEAIEGQQAYLNTLKLDCNNRTTKITGAGGFACKGEKSSCQSYLTFRSKPPYNSAVVIAYLLASDPILIASINQLTSIFATIPTDMPLVVPIKCSCSGQYYQYNASCVVESTMDTYFTVANNNYQGLSTCQAIMAQNILGERNLTVGDNLTVPIRCACPTRNQTASGVEYLLSYVVTWGDTIFSIAEIFGVHDQRSLFDANELSEGDNTYPFTTILIPLTARPTKIQHFPVSSPPACIEETLPSFYPPQLEVRPPESTYFYSKKWILLMGIGIGAGSLFVLDILAVVYCFCGRWSKERKPFSISGPNIVSERFRRAVKSLTVYKFEDLQIATGNFSPDNKIRGSVYKGSFEGGDFAIKVMQGDVSNEINILNKINHCNIIRLYGFCLHEGNTYLVYEHVENGSLSDWLHSNRNQASGTLQWKQRVQIACDVADALDYLHKYTNPPYIHKNLKTSNILLDANFRAKVSNFCLARSVEKYDQSELQLTRHVVGARGYMAPEYAENGVITTKLDVFALGIVILELLSGREAATSDASGEDLLSAFITRVFEGDNAREKLKSFIDPSLGNEYPLDLAFSMAQLAQNCVARDLNARPSMSQVSITLINILSTSNWYPYGELYASMSISSGR